MGTSLLGDPGKPSRLACSNGDFISQSQSGGPLPGGEGRRKAYLVLNLCVRGGNQHTHSSTRGIPVPVCGCWWLAGKEATGTRGSRNSWRAGSLEIPVFHPWMSLLLGKWPDTKMRPHVPSTSCVWRHGTLLQPLTETGASCKPWPWPSARGRLRLLGIQMSRGAGAGLWASTCRGAASPHPIPGIPPPSLAAVEDVPAAQLFCRQSSSSL